MRGTTRYKAHADQYRADPEKRAAQNAYQNEWRRRERSRIKAGLPRVAGHRATTNERIDNERAADEFFARPRSPDDTRVLQGDLNTVAVHAYMDEVRRERSLSRYARRLLAELQRPARTAAAVETFLASRAGNALREEVHMDVIARLLRNKPAYPDLQAELHRRARELVTETTPELHPPDDAVPAISR